MRIYQSNNQVIIATEAGDEITSIATVDSAMTLYGDSVAITRGERGNELERVKYVNVMDSTGALVGDKTAVITYLSEFIGLLFTEISSFDDDAKLNVNIDSVTAGTSLDVNIQDQHTPSFNLYFSEALGAPTTTTVETVIDSYDITVASTTNFSVGTWVGVFSGGGRYYWGEVLAINGSVLTMDSPFRS